MKRKLMAVLVGMALAAAPLAVLAQAAKKDAPKAAAGAVKLSDGVVKIGVLTDLSGLYSDLSGAGAVIAVKMAIDDFMAMEKGKAFPIELVSADHQNKGDVASNKAREWFERDQVDMITDLVTTSTALAVMPVAKEKNRITIVNGAASTPITGSKQCTDTNVHYTYDTYALANGTGKAVVKQGGDTWFFLTADYAFGHALEKDTTATVLANGGKVLGSVRHPFPAHRFIVVPAESAVLGREGDRACQRRHRHHQLDQAGGRIRHHAEAVAGRAPDVHHRRAQSRPEGDAGHVSDRRFLLGLQR